MLIALTGMCPKKLSLKPVLNSSICIFFLNLLLLKKLIDGEFPASKTFTFSHLHICYKDLSKNSLKYLPYLIDSHLFGAMYDMTPCSFKRLKPSS